MFHRSNSSSHIPVRSNLFGNRETGIPAPSGSGLKRAQSSSRLSNNEYNANNKKQRNSSLDRKTSLTRLSKLTPLNKQGRITNSAIKSTPGSSTMSQRYRSRITQSAGHHVERKTIQKLASDKKWVSEQYSKVQNFIHYSNLFDVGSFDSTNNLKPPSIKTFINVTSILFKSIFININIKNENYKEVIPEKLRVLRYPGKLTNSTLITVNTMGSWPQVVGMWGFLVDKIKLSNVDEFIIENLDPEERRKVMMAQTCWDFMVERHALFNANDMDDEQSSDDVQILNDGYVSQLTEILDVDPKQCATLKASVLEKEQYQKKLDTDIEELLVDREKIVSEITDIQKKIAIRNDSMAIQQKETETELSRLHKAIDKAKSRREDIEVNIDTLKEAIRVQPCTHTEKMELLKKIEKLENKIVIIKGKLSHAQKIRNEFDEKLNSERSMLQNRVIEWNRSLLEVSIKKPYLKKLMLRETGFHKFEFLDEIKEMVEEKVAMENEVVDKIGKIEGELKEAVIKKKSLEIEIHNFESQLEQLNKDLLEKTESKNHLDKQLEQMQSEWELEKKAILQEIHDPQMSELVESKTAETVKLETQLNNLHTELGKLSKYIMCFFTDLNNQTRHNIQEMKSVMVNVENRLVQKAKQALDDEATRIETLHFLMNLKK